MGEAKETRRKVRIELTEAQQQIRGATGNEVSTIELAAEQLEDRVAPARVLRAWGDGNGGGI